MQLIFISVLEKLLKQDELEDKKKESQLSASMMSKKRGHQKK
jgi:hypothetical protein